MILQLPSQPLYYCDQPACLTACVREAPSHQPVTRAWRVPMTAVCASCGDNLYVRAAQRDAEQARTVEDYELCLRVVDIRKEAR